MKILKSEDIKRILSLARWTLRENEEYLNSLNVFPVPDGDTGTNMYLTVDSGWYAIKTDTNGTLKNVLRVFSREAVMGARGNSGIILAQFFAGVKDVVDTEEYIPLSLIPSILDHATKEAIYSIGNPVRGTILTVMEEVKDAVKSRSFKTMEELSEFIVRVGYNALNRTPDLLPILKEAGVVDAGAQGFCLILDAFNAYLTGKKPKIIDMDMEVDRRGKVWHTRSFNRFCVNITVDTCSFKIKEKLKKLGDSLIVGHEENLVKVHIHTNNPPLVVDTCKKEGNIVRVQINDTEKEQKLFLGEGKEGLSVIAYSNGDGLKDIMMSMGASLVLSGEQNPSTGEIVSAIERIGRKAIILPNHSNIISAAMKAKELANIQCEVVKTKSVPEGISALLAFREDGDLKEVMRDMESASVSVLSGEIKWAVRDAKIGGKIIKKGDTLCLKNKKLISVSPDPDSCLIESIYNLIQGHSLITIYYGKSLEDKNHDSLLNQIKKRFPSLDIQMYYGGMTNAYYLFSLE